MNSSRILNALCVIGMIIAFGLWIYERRHIPEPTVNTKEIKVDLPIEKRYTDTAGNEHVVVRDGQNVISQMEIKNPARPRNIIDSSAKLLNIATSEIQRVTRISTITKDSLLKARRIIDALTNRLAYVYNDKNLRLQLTLPKDSVDSATFAYAYNADLDIVQYSKRSWFLGQKRSYIDISSKERQTTINGVKQLVVEQKTPQFGLRFQATAHYNPYTKNYGLGPGVRIDLGRFSIQGNYLFYQHVNKWYPVISGNYDIIRF